MFNQSQKSAMLDEMVRKIANTLVIITNKCVKLNLRS